MLHSTSQQKTLICPRRHGSRSAHYLGFSQIRLSGGKKIRKIRKIWGKNWKFGLPFWRPVLPWEWFLQGNSRGNDAKMLYLCLSSDCDHFGIQSSRFSRGFDAILESKNSRVSRGFLAISGAILGSKARVFLAVLMPFWDPKTRMRPGAPKCSLTCAFSWEKTQKVNIIFMICVIS